MSKALGFSAGQVETIAKALGKFSFGEFRDGTRDLLAEMKAAGFDPEDARVRHFARLFLSVQNLPRHLGSTRGHRRR